MNDTTSQTASTLKRLRLASGMTQTELAEEAGVGQADVSLLENGNNPHRHDALELVLAALGATERALTGVPPLPASAPLLRAYADAHQSTVTRNLATCELVAYLMKDRRLRTIRNAVPLLDGHASDPTEIDDHALHVRRAARIEDHERVGNVVQTLEDLGCLVLPMDDELGRHLGMSTMCGDRPFVMVARAKGTGAPVPGDRQRFTASHELGHVALHEDRRVPQTPAESRELERQAHRFAGAFLLPTEAALNELDRLKGRITLQGLAQIKGRWGIAIKALVKRYSDLGLIDDEKARSLYKQISNRGWNQSEPVRVGGEAGRWLRSALQYSAPDESDPVDYICTEAGIPSALIRPLVDWEQEGGADVVEIDTVSERRSTSFRGSDTDRPGTVTRLHQRS